MRLGWAISAGQAGGNIDMFLDMMGNPRDFGYSGQRPGHILFAGHGEAAGLRIDMVWDGTGTRELRLRGPDGNLLVDIEFKAIAYNVDHPTDQADSQLDRMMTAVQSWKVALEPAAVSFKGGIGDDTFTSGRGWDTLTGGAGNDLLSGSGGADSLVGGAGNDTLIGGTGVDRLAGNAGADMFVFAAASEANGDRIVYFSAADGDKIDLSGFDAIVGNVGLDHFTLIDNAAFGGHAGELRFVSTVRTLIEGDVDGDGQADFTLTLAGVTELDAAALLLA